MPRVKKTVTTEESSTPIVAPVIPVETTPAPATQNYYFGVGRRKTATARVYLFVGNKDIIVKNQKLQKGDIYVNDLPIDKYFAGPMPKALYSELFRTTNTQGRFITIAKTEGSGKSGQLGAVILGIARALSAADPRYHVILRKRDFMTRDSRARERKKPGLMGARKQKSSPKR